MHKYTLLALFSAFSAPLAAHPAGDASIFVYDDARAGVRTQSGAKALPEMTGQFKGPGSSFMALLSETGERRTTLNVLAQNTAEANAGADVGDTANLKDGANPRKWGASWGASLGYRHVSLDFNIGFPGGAPDVLSELEYDAEMTELRVNGDWRAANGLTVTGEAAYAYGFSGDVRDSDYAFDGRQGEFSRSNARTHGSTSRRLAFGAGWRVPLPNNRIGVTPLAGYTYQDQDWRSRHGRQTVSEPGLVGGINVPPVGWRLSGLDSHYKPRWHGPWLGVQLDANLARQFDLRFGLKHQWSRYYAEGEWNLREDLRKTSFKHHGDSRGWQTEIGALWRFLPNNAIAFTLDWGKQRLTNGSDRKFFTDGTTTKIRLNEVNAESWAASLGYRMDF